MHLTQEPTPEETCEHETSDRDRHDLSSTHVRNMLYLLMRDGGEKRCRQLTLSKFGLFPADLLAVEVCLSPTFVSTLAAQRQMTV